MSGIGGGLIQKLWTVSPWRRPVSLPANSVSLGMNISRFLRMMIIFRFQFRFIILFLRRSIEGFAVALLGKSLAHMRTSSLPLREPLNEIGQFFVVHLFPMFLLIISIYFISIQNEKKSEVEQTATREKALMTKEQIDASLSNFADFNPPHFPLLFINPATNHFPLPRCFNNAFPVQGIRQLFSILKL